MKLFFTLLALITASSPALYVDIVREPGLSSNRVNLVFVSSGFGQDEIAGQYIPFMERAASFLLHDSSASMVYARYVNFINIYSVEMPSDNAGAAVSAQDAEALSAPDAGPEKERPSPEAVVNALKPLDVRPDWGFLVTNGVPTDAAVGRNKMALVSTQDSVSSVLFRAGQVFHGLGSEGTSGNESYTGREPYAPNLTTDPTGSKWEQWIGYEDPVLGTIGAYEGGLGFQVGIFRPASESAMAPYTSSGCYHHAVSREKMILDIYRRVNPVDAHTPNSETLVNPGRLSLKLVDSRVSRVDWYVDGMLWLQNAEPAFDFQEADIISSGIYEIRAHVYDEIILHSGSDNASPHPLDLVRRNLDMLQQTITWQVQVDAETAVGKAGARRSLRFISIQPDKAVFRQPSEGNFSVSFSDLNGRLLGPTLHGTGHAGINEIEWNIPRFGCSVIVSLKAAGMQAQRPWFIP